MLSQLQLHPKVMEELFNDYEWYEERSVGLGDRLMDAVQKCLDLIIKHPERSPPKKIS
jgi:hypothetical protein